MAYYAQPQMITCYLSQQTHPHINGICTLTLPGGSTSLPFRFEDDEVDDV